ncbi:ERF family protein [[Kitasatospora] papulosa]|uniref:ERF family protein n=1 Tax=[Kitasatospora] papulosa TaxID=1464011 RepID=A0ABZ1K9I2_9ACTN
MNAPSQHAAPAAPPLPAALAAVEVTYEPAPADAPTGTPRVFAVVAAVMADTMPVGKNQENKSQNYKFRGIDDVMSAMAGPMRSHGLFILPSVASHRQERRGEKMTHTLIRMRYRIYGPAGDCLIADVPGEASDFADKGTNKAQSAALKYLLFTLFMLPVDGRSIDDSDRDQEPPAEHRAERQQRGQQGKQGKQQRGRQQGEQQPRRSDRAEPGPWEQQAPQQQRGRTDYLEAARKTTSREAFDKVRAAAVKAGAPDRYLAELDQIAANKANGTACGCGPREVCDKCGPKTTRQERRDRPAPGQTTTAPTTPPAAQAAPPAAVPDTFANNEHAVALGEMYDAGKAAQLADNREADALFASQFGCPPAKGTPEQLRTMRDDLLEAAEAAPQGVAA